MTSRARRVAASALLGVVMLAGCASDEDDVARYVDRAISEMRDGIHADSPEFQDAVTAAEADLKARSMISDTHAGLAELAVAVPLLDDGDVLAPPGSVPSDLGRARDELRARSA